jgi:hypothetical protein
MSDALKSLEYGHWKISSDATGTGTAYAKLTAGSPEECGCEPCRNFAAQRNRTYSTATLALFESLGIASNREAEIYHMARLESGKHLYGGWSLRGFDYFGCRCRETSFGKRLAA